jgi:predicted enzyme related to lactoylglutathione lyase
MAIRYAHTNIIADDWERLASFYEAALACARVPPPRDQSGAWLDRGTGLEGARLRGVHLRLPGHGPEGPTLEIYQYDAIAPAQPAPANQRGLGHLAFAVDDVAAVLREIIARGGSALGSPSETEVPGVGVLSFVYARDPEGNIIELQRWSRP